MHSLTTKYALELMTWESRRYLRISLDETERMCRVAALFASIMQPSPRALFDLYEREASAMRIVSPSRNPADYVTFKACIDALPKDYVKAARNGHRPRVRAPEYRILVEEWSS